MKFFFRALVALSLVGCGQAKQQPTPSYQGTNSSVILTLNSTTVFRQSKTCQVSDHSCYQKVTVWSVTDTLPGVPAIDCPDNSTPAVAGEESQEFVCQSDSDQIIREKPIHEAEASTASGAVNKYLAKYPQDLQ
jgi:hypothetical protein